MSPIIWTPESLPENLDGLAKARPSVSELVDSLDDPVRGRIDQYCAPQRDCRDSGHASRRYLAKLIPVAGGSSPARAPITAPLQRHLAAANHTGVKAWASSRRHQAKPNSVGGTFLTFQHFPDIEFNMLGVFLWNR